MWINSFLDYLKYERAYSELTISQYGADLLAFKQYMEQNEAEFNPREATPAAIREWVIALMDKGLGASSVNTKLSALRSFYKYLLRQGEIDINPMRNITGPKKNKTLPAFVREREMNKLLDETPFAEGFDGCRDKLVIEVFYHTGMRLAELVGLNEADVDPAALQLKVTGKRNKQRIIPFGQELKTALSEYLDIKRETFPQSGEEAFFVGKTGKRISRAAVSKIVNENLSKVVTQKKRSPHVLRHTFATTMLNNEAELEAIKELLGHQSLAATEVYTHTTFEELKKVYKQAHPRA